MTTIADYLRSVQIGEAQAYKNLALFPLLGPTSKLEYLVFDEAVQQGLQIEDTGTVPSLRVRNTTGRRVLILQGEYVIGGKQNRMFVHNLFIDPDFQEEVAVNCVQQHRWTSGLGTFTTSGQRAHTRLRRATMTGQGEVWNEVRSYSSSTRVHSATGDLSEIYQQQSSRASDYLPHYELVEGAVGIAAMIDLQQEQKVISVDLFDQPSTLRRNFRKLVESYVLEALPGGAEIKPPREEVKTFLHDIGTILVQEEKTSGLGKSFRVQGQQSQGSVLLYEDQLLYLTVSSVLKGPTGSAVEQDSSPQVA